MKIFIEGNELLVLSSADISQLNLGSRNLSFIAVGNACKLLTHKLKLQYLEYRAYKVTQINIYTHEKNLN